jgi:hypothetical protein
MAYRTLRRSTAVGIAVLAALAGCAAEPDRAYYNDMAEGGPGPDATSDTSTAEGSVGNDATGNDATGTDANGSEASGDDAIAVEASSVDAGQEAGHDAAPETGPPVEAGCGTPNTIQNCGSCGASCDQTQSVGAACTGSACTYSGCKTGFADCDMATNMADHDGCETPTTTTTNCGGCGNACGTQNVQAGSMTTCAGGACSYMCATGYSNCNQTAPNTKGCECATPMCCPTTPKTCETIHSNGVGLSSIGLGQNFYDCNALGTMSALQAQAACLAAFGNAGRCTSLACKPQPAYYVCNTDTLGNCLNTCWAFGGTQKGQVTDCSCPGNTFGPWN